MTLAVQSGDTQHKLLRRQGIPEANATGLQESAVAEVAARSQTATRQSIGAFAQFTFDGHPVKSRTGRAVQMPSRIIDMEPAHSDDPSHPDNPDSFDNPDHRDDPDSFDNPDHQDSPDHLVNDDRLDSPDHLVNDDRLDSPDHLVNPADPGRPASMGEIEQWLDEWDGPVESTQGPARPEANPEYARLDHIVTDLYMVTEPRALRQVVAVAHRWLEEAGDGQEQNAQMVRAIEQAEAYLAAPPRYLPSRYQIPGSGQLETSKSCEVIYYPPNEDHAVRRQVEQKCEELGLLHPRLGEGWMYLPSAPDSDEPKPGPYPVTDQLTIIVRATGEVVLDAGSEIAYRALREQGFTAAGGSRMVEPPRFEGP